MSVGAPRAGILNSRRTLGILTTPQKDIFHSHYHAGLLAGIFRRCKKTKTCLKIIMLPPGGFSGLSPFFHQHALDGLMILTWRWIHPEIAKLIEKTRDNRILVVNDPLPELGVNIVYTDADAGIRLAVRHLVGKGIRKIGIVHGPLEVPFYQTKGTGLGKQRRPVPGKKILIPFIDTRLKKNAFISALRSKKIPVKRSWIRSTSANSEAEGFRIMKKWLREKKLPEAVLCGNDDLAFGVVKAIKNVGLHCPKDLAVIGFDDNDRAGIFAPPLTTVRQPLTRMGKDAVDILLARIARLFAQPIRKKYPPELIVRKTA